MSTARVLSVLGASIVVGCADPGAADPTQDSSGGDPTSQGATSAEGTVGPPTSCDPLVACDGACVDVDVDPEHCGGCDAPCVDGMVCIAGACDLACGDGSTRCGDHCTDTQVDPAHCGGCDTPCGPGVPCVAGTCTPDCDDDMLDCGGTCIAIANDESNCGACGIACDAGQPCVFGQCVAASLHHLLITGQSLSTGAAAAVVSTEQPFANVMFNTGVRAGGVGLVGLVPLVETSNGGEGETIASGFANLLTELTGGADQGVRSLASAHGIGGQPYTVLRKGTAAYANGMAQAAAAASLAAMAGDSLSVRAMAVIHGETDHGASNQNYDQNLLEWQSDYDADVRALTGQLEPVVMFTDQMSSFTALGSATSTIPQQQLAAARARPDRIFIVAPKYMLAYVADGVHLTGDGERMLGELYARAWRTVLVDGERWLPVSPRAIERTGAVITLDFHVPAPPLVLDTALVTDPGNFGFSFTDSSGATPAITAVELDGDTAVRVTLAAPPTGGNMRIRYAMTGVPGAPAGPATGARGNLRDSDATVSRHGYPLHNWSVHFDEPVP